MWPLPFPWLTTTGGAGLEFIISGLLGKNLLKKGLPKICKKFFSKQSHAIKRLMSKFGSRNRNLAGFSPGKEVPKTIFKLG
jgi:hypothetical protein